MTRSMISGVDDPPAGPRECRSEWSRWSLWDHQRPERAGGQAGRPGASHSV